MAQPSLFCSHWIPFWRLIWLVSGFRHQPKEQGPSTGPAPEVVEIATLGQQHRLPPLPQRHSEAFGGLTPSAIAIQEAKDHPRPGHPPKPSQREISTA